ncbi:PucR family transcriptional regulator [Streptomyces odontomachi]|uniref:PucR family transcriptional regulator n=1 Tax=Streptomyces odontomachi TaxID=2944940 RepID=UPI00210B29A2|nr:PucR family transcriptional regulator [Streptomyces sp. ODS25]
MRLRALLETDVLGLKLLGGEEELDRVVRGVMTTDLRDPSRYLSGGELVLTGLAWRRAPADSERFVRLLTAADVAALAAGEAELGDIPEDLVQACARHRLPLFAVHESVAFATVTEHIVRQVSAERAGDLAAVVDRHRRLMTSGPAGDGLDTILDLLGSDLDLRAWVLSATGRLVAGPRQTEHSQTGPGHPEGDTGAPLALPADVAVRLATAHRAAVRTGRPEPHRVPTGRTGQPTYSLFAVDGSGRPATEAVADTDGAGGAAALSDWLLAVEADAGDWPAERLDLLRGVTQLIAVERDRRNAARTVRRRLAQEILELARTGAAAAEIAARLRVAAPVLLPGLGTAPHWQLVVARLEVQPRGDAAGGHEGHQRQDARGRPGGRQPRDVPYGQDPQDPWLAQAGQHGHDVRNRPDPRDERNRQEARRAPAAEPADRDGAAAQPAAEPAGGLGGGTAGQGPVRGTLVEVGAATQALLEEILVDPRATGTEPSDRLAVAHIAGEAVALVPLPPAVGQDGAGAGLTAEALLAAVREPLSAGLGDGDRLTLGCSAVVQSAEGLRGALEEARHARRVAAARPGQVSAAGHDELASHVLLLPFVPDDVRRAFTARLLDPLRDYDRRHRAELVATLEAFLDSDGSWTRCATQLHLHVNTLRYRIGRIEQLTGRDLSRLEDKLDFFLALRMT